MPIVIPTRDELAAMGWRERNAWAKRLKMSREQVNDVRFMLASEQHELPTAPAPKHADEDVSRCGVCGGWQWRGVCRVVHR